MKKIIKILTYTLLALLLAAGGLFTAAHLKTQSTQKLVVATEAIHFSAPNDQASIQRGEHLVQVRGCMDCHDSDLGGKTFINEPPIGTYTGSNLTRGKGSAVANFTDEDWARAIRFGVSSSFHPLVFMPSPDFAGMTDEDLGQMVAYLKQLPPVDRENEKSKIGPVAKLMYFFDKMPVLFSYQLVNRSEPHLEKITAEPTAKYGKYLAQSCTGCHRPDFSGGKIPGTPPNWPAAANIGKNSRVQTWSLDQFQKVLTEGQTPDGHQIDPQFMPWQSTRAMNETEITALYEYVKSL